MTPEQLHTINELFDHFVRGYEDLYYCQDLARLSVCTANIHMLLHIGDTIRD